MAERKRRVYIDIETNGLVRPTKIWCIVCVDLDTKERFHFTPNSPLSGHIDFQEDFIKFTKECYQYVGHNIVSFDIPNINRCMGEVVIKWQDCEDTLVLSRLFRPTAPFKEVPKCYNRQWGHSLEAWGRYLNFPKGEWSDWSKFSQPQLEYCDRDCDLGIKIVDALRLERQGFSEECIALEHAVAYMLNLQTDNGFYLDQVKARKLRDETGQLLEEMNGKLQILFPPTYKFVRTYVPKVNKDGTTNRTSVRIIETYQNTPGWKAEPLPEGGYNLYIKEVFNPNSGDQVAKRLLELGWKPTFFTEKGNIKTDKLTMADALISLLEAHPDKPELRCLADYGIVDDRHTVASTWLEMANDPDWGFIDPETGEKRPDGRVHGSINPIGAATHRCSHYSPNMANIARVVPEKRIVAGNHTKFDRLPDGAIYLDEKEVALTGLKGVYGWDARDCWSVPGPEYCLVGADAAGIQLRALAHYMDDPKYTKALLEGDIHEVNRQAAGISTRNKAKTYVYLWIMGGGDYKAGKIVGVEESEYEALFKFATDRKHWDTTLKQYLMDKLRNAGMKATEKNTATIIKGFKTNESFLNKTPALKRLKKEIIPAMAKQGYLIGLDGRKVWIPNEHLAMPGMLQSFEAIVMKQAKKFYHDELRDKGVYFKQCSFTHDEFQTETMREYGDIVGQAMVKGIVNAGKLFNTKCPLDGQYKVGMTWAQTH